jgi:cell division protease FtsH
MANDQQPENPDQGTDQPPGGPEGNGGSGRKGPQPPPPLKVSKGLLGWVVVLFFLIMLFVGLNSTKSGGKEIPTWQEFTLYIEQDDVEENSIIVRDDRVTARVKPGAQGFPPSTEPRPIWVRIDAANRDWFLAELKTLGSPFKLDTGTSIWLQLLMSFAPILLIILIIWFFIARSMRGAGAGPGGMLGSFGKSRHRISSKDMVDVTFDNVAGVDEAKEWVAAFPVVCS